MGIATVNPATGEVVKTFTALSDAEVEAKVQRAAETFLSYRKVPFADRGRMMTKAAEILEKEKEGLRAFQRLCQKHGLLPKREIAFNIV